MFSKKTALALFMGLVIFGLVAAQCAAPAPPQTIIETVEVEKEVIKEVTVAAPSRYEEAPMLADMVSAGEIPPLDDRLPENPFVVGPGVLVRNEDLPDDIVSLHDEVRVGT